MDPLIQDLRNAIYETLRPGVPYDGGGYTEDHELAARIAHMTDEYLWNNFELEDLRKLISDNGVEFDIDWWLRKQIDAGRITE